MWILFYVSFIILHSHVKAAIFDEFANPTLLLIFFIIAISFFIYLTSPLSYFSILSHAIIQTINMIITSLHRTKCMENKVDDDFNSNNNEKSKTKRGKITLKYLWERK